MPVLRAAEEGAILCQLPSSRVCRGPSDSPDISTNQHAEEANKLQAQVDKARSHAESLLTGPIVATEGRLAGAKDWRELRAAVASAEQRCDLLRAQIASRTSSMEKREIVRPLS